MAGYISNITLRTLGEHDVPTLARLAEKDSAAALSEPVLGAEVDGSLIAAISLRDGKTVADPFRRTVEAVDLLHARVRQLRGPRFRRRGRARAALAGSPPGAGGRLLEIPHGPSGGWARIT